MNHVDCPCGGAGTDCPYSVLAVPNGHVVTTDEKLLRIETAVDEMAADVKTLIGFVEALIGSAKSAKDNAPGFMKGMLPDIPELNHVKG